MSDIFQEVSEDLRRDRAVELWAKYRIWIIAGAVCVLLGTAGSVAWKNYREQQNLAASDAYQSALAQLQKEPTQGQESLQTIVAQNAAFSKLAEFQLAAQAIRTGDKMRALTLLAPLTENTSDPAAQGLAALESAYLAIDLKSHDQAEKLLTPLMAEGNAYRPLALEASLLNELQKGDKSKAKSILLQLQAILSTPNAPSGLAERVQHLAAGIGS